MPDPSPNQRRVGSGSDGDSRPLGLSSRATVPPSEPRGSRGSFDALDAQLDRPARLQMIVALMLGLVLVAIPLYLWRRPRAESISVARVGADSGPLPAVVAAPTASAPPKVAQDPVKILACSNPGPRRTPVSACDRVRELEDAVVAAIEASASCMPADAGGGTIVYVADVSFRRRSVAIGAPKDGRTVKTSAVVTACEKAVKARLAGLAFDAMKHDHARYKLQVRATYPAAPTP